MAQRPELFRREAVDHVTHRLAGDVILMSPLSVRLLISGAAVVFAAALLFLSLASYSRVEPVTGWVVPEAGLIRVTAHESGVVTQLPVREGDVVRAGETVSAIRVSAKTRGGDFGDVTLAGVAAQSAAAAAQNQASLARLRLQSGELQARRAKLEAGLGQDGAAITALEGQLDLANAKVARGESLVAKGFQSNAAVDDLRAAALSIRQQLATAKLNLLDLQRAIGDIDHERASLDQDLLAARASGQNTAAELAQRRAAAEAGAEMIAAAPLAARVVALPAVQGQSVAAGAVLAVLAPVGSPLVADLYVPSRAMGFIRTGQAVRLMYEPFPYQTFGSGRGTVQAVSSTVLSPAEVAASGTVTVQEPVSRVRVRLQQASLFAYGERVALQPGMLLKADVVLERRSLMQWLLDPLYAAGRRL